MLVYLFPIAISIFSFYRSLFPPGNYSNEVSTTVLAPRTFKKLIYIVLDGLRFDGFVPVKKKGHYFNKMNITSDKTIQSHVYFSVAGIPTCTTCRIFSLLTGVPSNQAEELYTFIHKKVRIDNLISQLKDKSVYFYGDECWTDFFENLKFKSKTMCSYSKEHLEEKENEFFEELIQKIRNKKEPDFLFAHFISLDSYGHLYGIDHPIMESTLKRFNSYLEQIYHEMDSETLLVVISDHGVTDQGAHGGSSEYELASICGLFYKDNLLLENDLQKYNSQFISRFYSTDQENDWVKAENSYKTIHQDDILVTLCYLLGIPVLSNAYGNLIPYLINDQKAQSILADMKIKNNLTSKKLEIEFDHFKSAQREKNINYLLTDFIQRKASERNITLFTLWLVLSSLILFAIARKVRNPFRYFHVLFAIVMASHSYWSFASEDILWWAVFILENFSISNITVFLFYLITPRRIFFSQDRIKILERLFTIEDKHRGLILSVIFIIHAISKSISLNSKFNLKFNMSYLRFLISNYHILIFSIYGCCSIKFSNKDSIVFLCSYPSISSLISIHTKPLNSILLIFMINFLDSNGSDTSKYSLLSIIPYACNLENVVQSIDYNTFFTFTDSYDSLAILISFISYFVLMRWSIISKFNKRLGKKEYKHKYQNNSLFIMFIGIYICYICSWIMHNSLVFTYFFISRLFFITGYFIADICLEIIWKTIKC